MVYEASFRVRGDRRTSVDGEEGNTSGSEADQVRDGDRRTAEGLSARSHHHSGIFDILPRVVD